MFEGDTVVRHYFEHRPSGDGYVVEADITDWTQVESMVRSVIEKVGRIDVLVNAAGVSRDSFGHKFDAAEWRRVVATNLDGSFHVARAVLPHMRENRFGRLVFVSSVVSQRPVMGTAAYSASKAALMGLTRTLAQENASRGITVNCISLGYLEAGMIERVPDALQRELLEAVPLKRFGTVAELHRTIEFLIDTEYMTGQVINLNGGLFMD